MDQPRQPSSPAPDLLERQTSDEPRVWVGCLASRNNGDLHGRWISADQPAERIEADIEAMLARSPIPNAEEYGVFDHDHLHGFDVPEYASVETIVTQGHRATNVAACTATHGDIFEAWFTKALDDGDLDEWDADDAGRLGTLFVAHHHGEYQADVGAYALDPTLYDWASRQRAEEATWPEDWNTQRIADEAHSAGYYTLPSGDGSHVHVFGPIGTGG